MRESRESERQKAWESEDECKRKRKSVLLFCKPKKCEDPVPYSYHLYNFTRVLLGKWVLEQ